MGSKRFYEHAQKLLGGVKKEVGNYRTWGEGDVIIIKVLYYYVMLYSIILYSYISIVLYYNIYCTTTLLYYII